MKKPTKRVDVPSQKTGGTDQEHDAEIRIVIEELEEDEFEDFSDEVEDEYEEEEAHPMSGLKSFDFETLTFIHAAHDKVAAVLKEGTASLPRAFSSNLARDRQNLKDGLAGGILGGAAALIGGDPVFFILAAPLGFIVRNIWNTVRIRSRRDKLTSRDLKEMESSELPELKSAWDLTCYKFVRLVKGYNSRVAAVNRIRENRRREGGKEFLRIADEWDRMLRDVYERLDETCAELKRHQQLLYANNARDLEELDDSLRNTDLLGYFDGVPLLDWLDISQDRILLSQVNKVFRADLEARQELKDLFERRKESFKELDHYLNQTEPIFDNLEREHGDAVRAIQEEEEAEDEES